MSTGFLLKGPAGKSLEVTERIVAGRNPDCDIVLVDGHPSRRHAQLTTRDGGVWIEDLGSANGTFVNDRRISAPVKLRSGDRIRFDAEQWEFVAPPATGDTGATVRRVAAEKPKAGKAPGSWADPDLKDSQGTKLFDRKDLQNMLQAGGGTGEPVPVVDGIYLSVKSGRLAGQHLKLEAGPAINVWDIGSDPGKDIVIPDDGISGFHAKIINEGHRWKLIDQMSANGTFVNGAKSNISYLASGDRIRFGPIDCVFRLPVGANKPARAGRRAWIIATVAFVATAAVFAIALWAMR